MKLVTGMRVKLKIESVEITDAKVYVVNDCKIYICQNKRDGSISPDKLGYDYSWVVNGGNIEDHETFNGHQDITNLEILDTMENITAGTVLVKKDNIEQDYLIVGGVFTNEEGVESVLTFDAYDESFDKNSVPLENIKANYYVKGEIPAEAHIKEVTIEEVAKAMGVPVETLRIKD